MTCGDNGGKNSIGEPCGRKPAQGFVRCNLHGGATAAAKIKAEQAMALSRMPAIEALHVIIEQFLSKTCAACGLPTGDTDEKRVIVRTAQAILDRTGMGPKSMIELTQQSDGVVNLELLTDDERAELFGLLARVKELKAALRQRAMGSLANPPALPSDVPPGSSSVM